MIDDRVRKDIAFIRETIEEGRSYATRCGPEMVMWGTVLAAGFTATYAFIRGWSPLAPAWLWPPVIALIWAYSLRRFWRRRVGEAPGPGHSPIVMSLRMLWLGLGIFLTTLGLAALWGGDLRSGWLAAVDAGAMGMAVFATAWLAGLPWLRWIAAAWWIGELAVFSLRHRPEVLLVMSGLMLLLLAAPGLALAARRRKLLAAAA